MTTAMPPAASSHSLMAPPSSLNSFAPVPSIYIDPGSPSASTNETEDRPWCYFDAATAEHKPKHSTPLNTDKLDDTLYMLSRVRQSPPPTFSRNAAPEELILPKRAADKPSAVIALERMNQEESGGDWIRRAAAAAREDEVGNDSEVVEVIKVRKHAAEVLDNQRPAVKRSKTLRFRATKALQTIKNVGKSNHAKIPAPVPPPVPTPPISPPAHSSPLSTQVPEPQPGSMRTSRSKTVSRQASKLARRSSYALSSLFSPQKSAEEERSNTPSLNPEIIRSPSPTPSPTLGSEDPARSPSPSLSPVLDSEDFARSPSPTLSTRTTRQRLSMLNLNRIFSPSQSAPSSSPQMPPQPRSSSGTSEASSSPATPFDDDEMVSSGFSQQQEEAQIVDSDSEPLDMVHERYEPELSFGEMKLDSLHFDELSFDATKF